jgi:hypothetical protein
MVTIAAFVGIILLLIGLALSAYVIYLSEERSESPFRGR